MERGAFCYIDDAMKQFQNHPVFVRKKNNTTILFLEDSIVDIDRVYILRYESRNDTIQLWYDSGDYSSPRRVQIHRTKRCDLNVAELYEWLVPILCPAGSGVHAVPIAKPVEEPPVVENPEEKV